MSTPAHSTTAKWKPQGEVPVHMDVLKRSLINSREPAEAGKQAASSQAGKDPEGIVCTMAMAGWCGD